MEKRFTRETKMTQNDLLAAIEALPKELQFALATSVLDRLAAEGPLPVSEQLKTEFLQREQAFFADPSKGESWDIVREELFGK
jgi:putative addiction module component (TIGR02574 family)